MFLPNSCSFSLVKSAISKPVIQIGIQESATSLPPFSSSDSGRKIFLPPHQNLWYGGLPNTDSFLLKRPVRSSRAADPVANRHGAVLQTRPVRESEQNSNVNTGSKLGIFQLSNGTSATSNGVNAADVTLLSVESTDPEQHKVNDQGKRTFLKVAGIAGVGLAVSLFSPKKAHALIMGSSPTTGVVGVKNAANTRINPATEETLDEVLKKTDLTFDTGSLQVKVTSLPSANPSSFSDSGDVAKSGLVDANRHVQVDVLSSALPTTASTETTLQTISFGGTKYALRLATAGDIDYVGEAAVGTVTSAALWRIKRVDNTSGVIILWADGNASFDNIWNNYASLSYS
jgi:hypothetical protein